MPSPSSPRIRLRLCKKCFRVPISYKFVVRKRRFCPRYAAFRPPLLQLAAIAADWQGEVANHVPDQSDGELADSGIQSLILSLMSRGCR